MVLMVSACTLTRTALCLHTDEDCTDKYLESICLTEDNTV